MSGSTLTLNGVAVGTASVTVTATDPDGLSATQSVGVTVETPNRAPVRAGFIPAQSIIPGRTGRLDVARYFSDPDGDALGYAATSSNAGVVSVSMSRSELTMAGVAEGTATVAVTATDPDGLSATQSVAGDGDVQPRAGAGRLDFRPRTSKRGGPCKLRYGAVLQRSGRRRAQVLPRRHRTPAW